MFCLGVCLKLGFVVSGSSQTSHYFVVSTPVSVCFVIIVV